MKLFKDDIMKIKENVKSLNLDKFKSGQKLLGKQASYSRTLYALFFAKQTNYYSKLFVDSKTIFYDYDKNNTNCLAKINFILTANESNNTTIINTVWIARIFLIIAILSISRSIFNILELDTFMDIFPNIIYNIYINPIKAVVLSILSILCYIASKIYARNKMETITNSIFNLLTMRNKENLVFEAIYQPITIKEDIFKLISFLHPISKEYSVYVIAYEKEKYLNN